MSAPQVNGCSVSDFVSVLPVPPQTERRRGVLRFIGPTEFAPGVWAGVEVVGAAGRNDGSVMGRPYFSCPPGQGVFVRPELVVPFSSEQPRVSEDHRAVAALLATRTAELQREREERALAAKVAKEQEVVEAKRVEEVVKKEEERRKREVEEATKEVQRLQKLCTDLKDLCDLQEEELQRQKDHADDLAQLVENIRCEHDSERAQMQEKISLLEEEVTQLQRAASEGKLAAGPVEKVELESLQLQIFQQQQEKEALRLLRQRYDQLHAERERERQEHEEKWRQASEDYETALAQQREHKSRLLHDLRQLQEQMKTMQSGHNREQVLQMPLSTAEREEYEAQVSRLQWELMQIYGEMFAKRYDHFLVPYSRWDSPADVFGEMSRAIASTARVLPFTTPEICQSSRMALFQARDNGVGKVKSDTCMT